jgi:hypothetical protein
LYFGFWFFFFWFLFLEIWFFFLGGCRQKSIIQLLFGLYAATPPQGLMHKSSAGYTLQSRSLWAMDFFSTLTALKLDLVQ